MRRLIGILLLIVLTMAVASAQQKAGFHPAPEIQVKVIHTPNIPLKVSQPAMQAEYGRGLYRLTFKMKNTGGSALGGVGLLLLAVAADGAIMGGETLCEGDVPAPGKEHNYVIPVASKFQATGDHAVLSFMRVRQMGGDRWTVVPKKVLDALAVDRELTEDASISTGNGPDFLCDPTFCYDCRQMAVETCQKGVHNVTCSINTCSCSFTCN